MTHRFYITSDQLASGHVTFSERQRHQIRSVLRLRRGDRVHVFDGLAPCDHVVELLDALSGQVVGSEMQAPEARTRLVAYPALLQRDKFETVLQKLTEVGVAAIAPVLSQRSLVRSAPDDARLIRWRSILQEAAEQSGRGVVPCLLPTLPFSEAVASAEGTRLVAYERERATSLADALTSRPAVVSLFVGPEGGFSPDEAACAVQAGASLVTLGPRVLRAETASPLFAGLVLYELGDLSWPA